MYQLSFQKGIKIKETLKIFKFSIKIIGRVHKSGLTEVEIVIKQNNYLYFLNGYFIVAISKPRLNTNCSGVQANMQE